jgi:alkylation response protein AidB-like acyl-CoA dehydrogenase
MQPMPSVGVDVQLAEGSFLLSAARAVDIFAPEDFSDEQRMIAAAARSFFDCEVAPCASALEDQDPQLIRRLLRRAAEIGFLSTEVPVADGGLGLGLVSAMLQVEHFARHMSFGMAIATQTGIGSLPVVFFGSEDQRRRYLPGIMSGELICAFALTEAQSGSDALAARATATLDSTSCCYVLNGEKMWVTNAAIADLFIVFAKIDGRHFTAFLVERGYPGLSLGAEESKMGMRGSSARPLILEDVRVPANNVLGSAGLGHRVAFGTLNVCRTKLGAGLVGAAKEVLGLAAQYSAVRTAFGKPLAEFELIKDKLARMTARIYAAESVVYRTAGLLSSNLKTISGGGIDALPNGIGFAIESSIVKVFTTEALDLVVDEAVQIHGSNGYSSAFAVERFYRDSRVNRIFEGTNEIHRLLITERLVKLAASGSLPLFEIASRLWAELDRRAPRPTAPRNTVSVPFEARLAERARQLTLILIGAAFDQFHEQLADKQLLMAALSDAAIETFAMQSVIARSLKADGNDSSLSENKSRSTRRGQAGPSRVANVSNEFAEVNGRAELRAYATSLFVRDAFEKVGIAGRTAAGIISASLPHHRLEAAVDQLTLAPVVDRSRLCTHLAAAIRNSGGYIF